MQKIKVIGIGFHKTGTSTLGDALIELGYEVVGARLDLTESLKKNSTDEAFELADQFEALQDVPWAILFKELDERYPGAKFILTVREEDKWLNSVVKHFGDKYFEMHEWIYGKGVAAGNEQLYLERYKKHNREVLEYFSERQDDLLVVDWSKNRNDWKPICDLLECPIPNKAFPHSNKGKHNYNTREKAYDLLRNFVPFSVRKVIVNLFKSSKTKLDSKFNNAVNSEFRGKGNKTK